jgi:hypothetical protein
MIKNAALQIVVHSLNAQNIWWHCSLHTMALVPELFA